MYDELQRSFETFQHNVNKLTFNVKHKKFMHLRQMTLLDIFKQSNTNPNFCQEICALNRDAYLNGCVLKWENTVVTLYPIFCGPKVIYIQSYS